EKIVNEFQKENKNIKHFKDPGKGKSYALNLIFKELNGDIWIFTDGDVFVGENSINELLKYFNDPFVGCVIGRPVSLNSKNNMIGFWSHLLFEAGAHSIRKELDKKNQFIEGTGYLFAFRSNITKNIPLNVAEDTIIPYITMKKGYKIRYADNAFVYVKNPTSLIDFVKQRVRTAKAHEALEEYAPFFPKVKSFRNEIKQGTLRALRYPNTLREYIWTFNLFFARLVIWIKVKFDEKILNKRYGDAWERIESTK
ncbi:MAG: glycosyltransferase, partial [Nanoarchaeota archaeon]